MSLAGLLSACGDESGIDAESVTGIPQAWLTTTADAWPESASFGAAQPILERGEDCLLLSSLPEILGETPGFTNIGFAPFGQDSADPDSYGYQCGLHASGHYAGELTIYHADSDAVTEAVEDFRHQPDIPEQDNTVTEQTSGQLDIQVVSRWYPTNPQGRYMAMYHDESQDALAYLELNSLDEDTYESSSAQEAADLLVELLAQGS